jgi:protein O-GlcNAcase / histone acetyltransferase
LVSAVATVENAGAVSEIAAVRRIHYARDDHAGAFQVITGLRAGVIEGFYGPPWSPAERMELLQWMKAWQLNTYVYAPKDDLKHRAAWREPYTAAEAEALGTLIRACAGCGVRFVYALSPGLDICYCQPSELQHILARFEQMLALGCDDFALLFDDIPDRMHPEDSQRWVSVAAAQCQVTNAAFRRIRERRPGTRFLFCPTAYCGRMAERQLGGENYLETVGRELAPEIDVFWTGPEIISREISVASVRAVRVLLRRKPLIWDNLHANDYDGRRFFCGPYSGRPGELRGEVSGFLCNPNTEFVLNFVALRTFASYLRSEGHWDARAAYLSALAEWLPRFSTSGGPESFEDLRLFGDFYYLPHEEGPGAEGLFQHLGQLLSRSPTDWDGAETAFCREATRLRDFCARLAEIRDRPLFHALHRRVWELREELDLVLGYVQAKLANPDAPFRSDYHLPGTCRGGTVARLQRLLTILPDGAVEPVPAAAAALSPTDSRPKP